MTKVVSSSCPAYQENHYHPGLELWSPKHDKHCQQTLGSLKKGHRNVPATELLDGLKQCLKAPSFEMIIHDWLNYHGLSSQMKVDYHLFGSFISLGLTPPETLAASPSNFSPEVRRERSGAQGIHSPAMYSLFIGEPRSYLDFPNHLIKYNTIYIYTYSDTYVDTCASYNVGP